MADASAGWALDVNDRGTIVGQLDGKLAVWKDGQIIRPPEEVSLGWPVAINNRNQVLLDSQIGGNVRTAIWDLDADTVTVLDTLGGDTSTGTALNDRGMVVGNSFTADREGPSPGDPGCDILDWFQDRCGAAGQPRAFFWHDGELVDLGTLGGDRSGAADLNEWGQVVGFSEDADGVMQSFLWYQGEMSQIDSLGGISGYRSGQAMAINNWGQVVGDSKQPDGPFHAYLWQNGRTVSLGEVADPDMLSTPVDINDRGQILGYTHGPGFGPSYGFLWSVSPLWSYSEGT